MKNLFGKAPQLILSALLAVTSAHAQGVEDDESPDTRSSGFIEEMDVIVVTGTRLDVQDQSARVDVVTAEEIAARGLSTTEDVIRSIPQNFSSINSATNLRNDNDLDAALGNLGLGISTANLRGLGSANTLVLVNGKRLSGAAGEEDFFANIRDIPASAIERVEVLLNGGSSIYGSDAVGGVINVILKKNYTGLSLTARTEQSSTDGDQNRYSGYAGYGWDATSSGGIMNEGSVSLTASYTETDPISNAKAGFVTRDYRERFGGDPAYDFRTGLQTRAGAFSPNFSNFMILPLGNSAGGVGTPAADYVLLDFDRDVLDFIAPELGGKSEDFSLTANVQQTFFDRLTIGAEILFTDADTRVSDTTRNGGSFRVPNTNAFFPDFVSDPAPPFLFVRYTPILEIEQGLIEDQFQINAAEFLRYSGDIDFDITGQIALSVNYIRSESKSEGRQFAFTGLFGATTEDPANTARIEEVLASSDPAVAVNLFGDGSVQNATIADLLVPIIAANDTSVTEEFSAYLKGSAFDLPGGPVRFVIGGEIREETLKDERGGLEADLGVASPTRDLNAYFGELWIPIIGPDQNIPFSKDLILVIQGRYDDYTLEGAVGTDMDDNPILQTSEFDNFSPRIGVAWTVSDELLIRGNWQESFRAPTVRDLFGTRVFTRPTPRLNDPLLGWPPDSFVPGLLTFRPNPDLQPETADEHSVGFEYSPAWADGLHMKLHYSRLSFTNRIANNRELEDLLPPEVFGNLSEFFIRDENGTLIELVSTQINISERFSETIDADVSYTIDAGGYGVFQPGLNLTYVLTQFDRPAPGAPSTDFVGKSIGIDEYSLLGRLYWARGRWSADLFVDYTPSYTNNNFEREPRAIENFKIGSRTTVDLSVARQLGDHFMFRAGARNLFDEDFPFAVRSDGTPYDASRVDPRGRVAYVEVAVSLE